MELGQLIVDPLLVIKDVMVVNIHLSSITLVRCHASEHLFVIYYSRSLSLSSAHTQDSTYGMF